MNKQRLIIKIIMVLLGHKQDMLFTFLSSFLGFGSAMLVAHYTRKATRNEANKHMLEQMKEDLSKIEIKVSQSVSNQSPTFEISPYLAPGWDAAFQTGNINSIIDSDIYKGILETYGLITRVNQIETLFYQYATMPSNGNNLGFSRRHFVYLNDARKRLKNIVQNNKNNIEEYQKNEEKKRKRERVIECLILVSVISILMIPM